MATAVAFLTAEEVAMLPRPDLSVAAPENGVEAQDDS